MSSPRYYSAVVTDNADPLELGRLRVICAELYGDADTELPEWIPPRIAAGAGPGAGWWWIPPVNAVVILEATAAGDLRWTGGGWGEVNAPPEDLIDNYPRRAGFTDPGGAHSLVLDQDTGLVVSVREEAGGDPVAVLELGTDGPTLDATGDPWRLLLDATRALLVHSGGARIGTSATPALGWFHVVREDLLPDLSAAISELAAFAAAWGVPVTNCATLIAGCSVGYRSSSLETD